MRLSQKKNDSKENTSNVFKNSYQQNKTDKTDIKSNLYLQEKLSVTAIAEGVDNGNKDKICTNFYCSENVEKYSSIMPEKRHFGGFDILRIVLSIIVVALHCNPFNVYAQYDALSKSNPIIYNISLFNIFWAAVPTFILLSQYLYIRKSVADINYRKKRIKYLAILAVVWNVIHTVLISEGNIRPLFEGKNFIHIFLLLIGNSNITYYLFVMLFITILCECVASVIRGKNIKKSHFYVILALFVASLAISFFARGIFRSILGVQNGDDFGFSNILIYLPEMFGAVILYYIFDVFPSYNDKKYSKPFLWICFGLFFVTSVADWFIQNSGSEILTWNYIATARVPMAFIAMTLVGFAREIKKAKIPFISHLSELSMGVFLTHTLIMKYAGMFFIEYNYSVNVLYFLIVFMLSASFTYIVKKTKLF